MAAGAELIGDALTELLGKYQVPPATHRCDKCGEFALYRPGLCGRCHVEREEETRRQQKIEEQLTVIPKRYRDVRFDTACIRERVADQRAVDQARTAHEHHRVLVLMGVPGSGKSTLAAATLAAWAEAGRSIAWAPALRLAHARAEARLGEEPEEVKRAIRANLLVVDDLGQEPLVTTSAVVDVIHARHDADRPIIVTTGVQRRVLAERYGGGTARRLLEHALVVEMQARRHA